jgi:hypothetical protein
MEMHLVRVILGESKAKEVLKMRKENKNSSKMTVKANSKSRMRRLSTKMEMHPVGVILEDGKVRGVLKQQKQSKNNSKEKVAVLKASNKSSKKASSSKDKMVVKTTKAKSLEQGKRVIRSPQDL